MSGKTPRSSTIQADRIGSLLFCPACGTLLSLPGDLDEIACEQCGRREPASCELVLACNHVWPDTGKARSRTRLTSLTDHRPKFCLIAYENLDVKTYSHPNAFPSSLRQKRALVQGHKDDGSRQKDEDPVVSLTHLASSIWSGTTKADLFRSKYDDLLYG
jgi:hypothetical protein